MARPRLPFSTDHPRVMRSRERLADLVYPGGLQIAARKADPGGALVERIDERSLPIEDRLHAHGPLLRELAAVLTDAEEATLMAALDDGGRAELAGVHPLDRRVTLICHGLALGLLDLEARTGLSGAMPPEDVHAMTHGALAAGGEPWYADLIDQAFTEVGAPIGAGMRVLDFGCSSGRAVRMLAGRRPQAQWLGCDVNAEAITWASAALPAIDFAVQPMRPPLPYPDASLDGAFAISIWSHFNEAPARAWLDELHRVIRPGGHALITTHGPGAVAFRAAQPVHGERAQRQFIIDLYRRGFSFSDTFGAAGDWGVVDPEWGASFMTPEWLLNAITPKWSVALYRTAAIAHHQDLWMLRRS